MSKFPRLDLEGIDKTLLKKVLEATLERFESPEAEFICAELTALAYEVDTETASVAIRLQEAVNLALTDYHLSPLHQLQRFAHVHAHLRTQHPFGPAMKAYRVSWLRQMLKGCENV